MYDGDCQREVHLRGQQVTDAHALRGRSAGFDSIPTPPSVHDGQADPASSAEHLTTPHVLDESAQIAAETLSSKLGSKPAKKAVSKRNSPSISSQMAASKKRWVM
jgi:hypothetical protein